MPSPPVELPEMLTFPELLMLPFACRATPGAPLPVTANVPAPLLLKLAPLKIEIPVPDVEVPSRARFPALLVIVFGPLKNSPLLLLDVPPSVTFPELVTVTAVLIPSPHPEVEVPLSDNVPPPE